MSSTDESRVSLLTRCLVVLVQVPQHVRDQIKTLHLLGYRGDSQKEGHQNGASNGSNRPQKALGAPANAA